MSSLSNRISKTLNKSPKKRSSALENLAFIIANHEEIQEALNDGWNVKIIHEQYKKEGAFTASYQAFRRALNKYLDNISKSENVTHQKDRLKERTPKKKDIENKKEVKPVENKNFEDIEVRQEDENSPRVVSVVKERFSYDNRKYMKD